MNEISKFIMDQLSVWPLASANFRSLKMVQTRPVEVGGLGCVIQYNPARLASTTADVDEQSIAARPCFLCEANRPPEQFHLKFEGRKERKYNIQVNPYPIFPQHLVVVRDKHLPQEIWHHLPDILDFTKLYPDYLAYYNGPLAGASAPDHLHFQACPRFSLPLEKVVDSFLDNPGEPLSTNKEATLYRYDGFHRGIFCLKATTTKSIAKLFYRLLDCCDREKGEGEPKFNLYAWTKGDEYRVMVCLRREMRSHHYFTQGPDHMMVTAGAAEMAGVIITPAAEDLEGIRAVQLEEMFDEICISEQQQNMVCSRLTRSQATMDVGIMAAKEIVFEIISDGAGPQKVRWRDGRIDYNGMLYDELVFDAVTRSTLFAEASFILHDIPIGIEFHWQRKLTRRFAGQLRFVVDGDKVQAINRIGVENYLLSVISSEMSPLSGEEYLRAHAVISRSWVYSQLKSKRGCSDENEKWGKAADGTPVYLKWWDRADHSCFDVCADDHCQRYQGLTDEVGDKVKRVIDSTWGEVLTSGGELCDARFSKCCGGMTERFSTCWEDRDYPYLQPVKDAGEDGHVYCNTRNARLLSQVLNSYDRQTSDFYEWEQRIPLSSLSELVCRRSGIDFGTIKELIPVERGASGRIMKLKIVGSKASVIIGKELMIRRSLSETHLKSSAFVIIWEEDELVLKGRGWGHGVGFCQIGAAVMADEGKGYRDILQHYYPGATIEKYE